MKLIITEEQLRLIIESEGEDNLLDFTPFMYADSDKWDNMFTHINKKKGGIYTGYYISGDLNLGNTPIKSLGNLKSVGRDLYLRDTQIKSLGNLESVGGNLNLGNTQIESLGNLESVGGDLYLIDTPIETLGNLKSVGGDLYLGNTPIETLGNLKSVGGDLDLKNTPLSDATTEEELRSKINVEGKIYL